MCWVTASWRRRGLAQGWSMLLNAATRTKSGLTTGWRRDARRGNVYGPIGSQRHAIAPLRLMARRAESRRKAKAAALDLPSLTSTHVIRGVDKAPGVRTVSELLHRV